jgi:hypothetical protein
MKQNQQMVDEVIWNLKGKCGHEIYLINPKNSNDKKLMFDAGGTPFYSSFMLSCVTFMIIFDCRVVMTKIY